ncbi:protein kinase [Streptomyces sp. NPDC046985]|uniref:protein kinase domain-containing protein n=1 Tax=Streptomyces sp. NPDC046985 TaxID=3155377 RepID=UPI0033C1ADE1
MGEIFAGRYELADPIGRGGVGAVWRAWDRRRRRYVAAKVLQQRDAHSLLRFVREQALRIDHPHVLAPASWAADDDKVLFTMDLVAGGSLVHLVNDYGPLPAPFVCTLLDQLLSGLAAVHAEGVVHRDIKPANVLLEATGAGRPRLRLSDFGIAMRLGEPRLTETDLVVGTPGYLAPEQMWGAEPDFPADLFATGLVALYLLQGARPDAKALVEHFTEHGTPHAPTGVPEPLWQVVATLLQPDPQARFRTATGARKALAAAAELLPEPGPEDEQVEIFDQLGPLPKGFGPDGPDGPEGSNGLEGPNGPVGTLSSGSSDNARSGQSGWSGQGSSLPPRPGQDAPHGPDDPFTPRTDAQDWPHGPRLQDRPSAESGPGAGAPGGQVGRGSAAADGAYGPPQAAGSGTGAGNSVDKAADERSAPAPRTTDTASPTPATSRDNPSPSDRGPRDYGPAPHHLGFPSATGNGSPQPLAAPHPGRPHDPTHQVAPQTPETSQTSAPTVAPQHPYAPAHEADPARPHHPPQAPHRTHPPQSPRSDRPDAPREPGLRAEPSTASYTAQDPRSPSHAPARAVSRRRAHRAVRPARPGPPAKVALTLLLLALVCYAVGFWALTRL